MNTTWSFASAATGLFTGQTFSGPDACLLENTPADSVAVPGVFDPATTRLDLVTGEVVFMERIAPVGDATLARAERDRRLAQCDWVVVRAIELRQAVATSWVSYRQDLRDVPNQPQFPHHIVWPEEPS